MQKTIPMANLENLQRGKLMLNYLQVTVWIKLQLHNLEQARIEQNIDKKHNLNMLADLKTDWFNVT